MKEYTVPGLIESIRVATNSRNYREVVRLQAILAQMQRVEPPQRQEIPAPEIISGSGQVSELETPLDREQYPNLFAESFVAGVKI